MITRIKNRISRLKNQKDYSDKQNTIQERRLSLLDNPNDGKLHFEYALAEFEQGNYFLALAELKTAEILGFDSPDFNATVEKCIKMIPELNTLNHNQYFRFKSLESALRKSAREKHGEDFSKISVLDVGGGEGTFSAFIPEFKYCLAEPVKNGISGESLPFENSSFDYAVSCHVLEHIPEKERELFLQTLVDKCRTGVFLLNPIFVPETQPKKRLEVYIELTDEDWAKEHLDCDLPRVDYLEKFAKDRGLKFSFYSNGNISTTLAYAYMEYFTRGDAEKREKFKKINQFFNSFDFDLMHSQQIPTAGLFYIEK